MAIQITFYWSNFTRWGSNGKKDILFKEPYDAQPCRMVVLRIFARAMTVNFLPMFLLKNGAKNITISTNSDIYLYDNLTGKTNNTEGTFGYDKTLLSHTG